MSKPTPDEVQKEIDALREIKPRVRRRTLFGDDNHAAIDAQIAVLEELLDEDDIYEEFDHSDHLRDNALLARTWLDGEWNADENEADGLSAGWESLAG